MPLDDIQQYARAKAQEIHERRQRRKVESEKSAADGKLKTVWAPKLWEQTRQEIRQMVQAVNEALGEAPLSCDEARDDVVIIRVAKIPSNLSASYDSFTGKIILALDDHLETYNLEVVRGEVKLKAVGYFSPGQVAKMLVDKAASMVL